MELAVQFRMCFGFGLMRGHEFQRAAEGRLHFNSLISQRAGRSLYRS